MNNNKKISTVLLMAAGMGTRIRPLSIETPKPLIKVKGLPMIETLIQAIKSAGIKRIIITVGYKKENYIYLKEKYSNIEFVDNNEYATKNTISSFYSAMNLLKGKNCLVCESDLYVSDPLIFKGETDKSRYYLRKVNSQNYEWGFEIQNERIKRVVRPETSRYLDHHMYGVAYWLAEDLEKLIAAVKKAYQKEGHEQKAYDEIANDIFGEIDMGFTQVKDGQIYEIDSIEDLVKVDPSYKQYLKKQKERG